MRSSCVPVQPGTCSSAAADFSGVHRSQNNGELTGWRFLKQHGIYVGLRIEFNVSGETL